ncbi:MAG: hypothetical protein HKL82_08500 [Acidimicrobiaceae bacterium]|nr:hypothetical protein [Acidimicrobiaceae bacterium]
MKLQHIKNITASQKSRRRFSVLPLALGLSSCGASALSAPNTASTSLSKVQVPTSATVPFRAASSHSPSNQPSTVQLVNSTGIELNQLTTQLNQLNQVVGQAQSDLSVSGSR